MPKNRGAIILRSALVCAVFSLVHEVLTRGAIIAEVRNAMKTLKGGAKEARVGGG